jgi:peptidoglycan DL-endopeptidase CwlO
MFKVRMRLLVSVMLLTVTGLVVLPGGPASAAPSDTPDGKSTTTAALQAALDQALRDYNDAKGRLDATTARQAQLTQDQATTAATLADLESRVGTVANAAYRGQKMSMGLTLLQTSPQDALQAATTVQYMVDRDNKDLHDLAVARKTQADQQKELADQARRQQDELATLDAKRKAADLAVQKAGGGTSTSGPSGGKATANAAPRNPDGSFASQSCTITDPTGTGGCITARMQNAYNEARKAGFTHYTKCWRKESTGEHQKGRACDFSANASTFVDARATGADKTYGDNLAAWFVANASRLGALYVIWYDRIWHPSGGWKTYTAGDGSPAGDHYNHVHLSVQ